MVGLNGHLYGQFDGMHGDNKNIIDMFFSTEFCELMKRAKSMLRVYILYMPRADNFCYMERKV